MNKLRRIFFPSRPANAAVSAFSAQARAPVRRRERLISVWIRDPATGRLVCSWRRPDAHSEAGEPPSMRFMAAWA